MKKVLSIVLSIAMVICLMPSMAFAATTTAQSSTVYSDTTGEACEGAVNVLSALGVVNGYEDGTYKPAQTVTRAEMAKLIVTALGLADYASATTSQFTDMTGSTWAIPYVEYAASLNIVNGYGGGKFGPNDTVTYEQALTMVVRALGYTDEAKEMNGTWPAVYVQKARALGLLEDVDNGGATGANRGDVAIILYNALSVNEVYVDNDGTTQNKKGTNGASYTTMMDTLNQGGSSYYGILSDSDADDALYNVRSYVGAYGKIIKNKDGDVLALGDVKTTFLTGEYTLSDNEFEADGVTYTLKTTAFMKFVTGTAVSMTDAEATDKDGNITCFVNGKASKSISAAAIDAFDDDVTIACKVSGKTITEVYSVLAWTGDKYVIADASDLKDMTSKHELDGKDLPEDNSDNIDYTAFELVGVDSIDDIKEDNVLQYWYSGDDITKLAVGTKTVEGTVTKIVTGADNTEGTAGKTKWEITIDGTKYKAAEKGVDPVGFKGDSDSETVSADDSVKLYLNAYGKIAKIEKVEGTSSYAVVIDLGYENDKDAFGKNDETFTVRMILGDGSKKDYVVEEDYVDDLEKADILTKAKDSKDGSWSSTLTSGSIVKYSVNSDNELTKLESAAKDSTRIETKTSKISKAGYFNGYKISESAPIFSLDESQGSTTKKAWKTVSLSSVLDSETTEVTYVLKDSKIEAMIVESDLTAGDYLYGVYLSTSEIKDGDYKYSIEMLVGGEKVSYKMEDSYSFDKTSLYRFQLNSDEQLDKDDIDDITASYLATATPDDNGKVATKNSSVTTATKVGESGTRSVSYDSDVQVYTWSTKDHKYEAGSLSDLSDLKNAGAKVYLYNAEDDAKDDDVADIILISKKDGSRTTTTTNINTQLEKEFNDAVTTFETALKEKTSDGALKYNVDDYTDDSLTKLTELVSGWAVNIVKEEEIGSTLAIGDLSVKEGEVTSDEAIVGITVTVSAVRSELSATAPKAVTASLTLDNSRPYLASVTYNLQDASGTKFAIAVEGISDYVDPNKIAQYITSTAADGKLTIERVELKTGTDLIEAADGTTAEGIVLTITGDAVSAGSSIKLGIGAGLLKSKSGNTNNWTQVTLDLTQTAFTTETSPYRVEGNTFKFELNSKDGPFTLVEDAKSLITLDDTAKNTNVEVSEVTLSGSAILVKFSGNPGNTGKVTIGGVVINSHGNTNVTEQFTMDTEALLGDLTDGNAVVHFYNGGSYWFITAGAVSESGQLWFCGGDKNSASEIIANGSSIKMTGEVVKKATAGNPGLGDGNNVSFVFRDDYGNCSDPVVLVEGNGGGSPSKDNGTWATEGYAKFSGR